MILMASFTGKATLLHQGERVVKKGAAKLDTSNQYPSQRLSSAMGPTAIVSKALDKPPYSFGVISTLADAIHAVDVALVGASDSAHWPAAASGSPRSPWLKHRRPRRTG
jgi:hypothetical protein